MFTKKINSASAESNGSIRRGRGRPSGPTPQGLAARRRLYETAIKLIAKRGYEATTLRAVAAEAGVSVGLLYKYFPSKRAVVLSFYDQLSAEYSLEAAQMAPGRWRDRFFFALKTSLDVLHPHRNTLVALVPILVGDANDGLFAPSTAFSRLRVQKVFNDAVVHAGDAPPLKVGTALGSLLYLVHLTIILWWLLDKSPGQRATMGFVGLLRKTLPSLAFALRVAPVRTFVLSADALFREALFGERAQV